MFSPDDLVGDVTAMLAMLCPLSSLSFHLPCELYYHLHETVIEYSERNLRDNKRNIEIYVKNDIFQVLEALMPVFKVGRFLPINMSWER